MNIVGVILILLSFIILWIVLSLFVKDRYRTVLATGLSISLALLGISLAIANDYLFQYDYSLKDIKKYESYRENGVVFDTLTEGKLPYYIFVRDVSGSIREEKSKILVDSATAEIMMRRVSDFISNQPDSLKRTIQTSFFDTIRSEKQTIIDNWIKLKLMYSVVLLDSIYCKDSTMHNLFKFSIVNFGDSVCCRNYGSEQLTTCITKISEKYALEKNTSFIKLFEHLSIITDTLSPNLRSQFYDRDVIIFFFTDYRNDDKKTKNDSLIKELQEYIEKIETSMVNLKLYVWEDEKKNQRKSTGIDIKEFLFQYLEPSSYMKLDIRELYDEIDYPITVKHPFPLYYRNSVFEDSLKTQITFKRGGKYSIRLGKYNNSMKQEYKLYKEPADTINTIIRLSKYDTPFFVRDAEKVLIGICGYIPSPYQCPDIIIKDAQKRVEYTIPVVFFKEFPKSSKWLLWVIVFFQCVTIIQLLNILIEGGSIMVRPSNMATSEGKQKDEKDEECIDVSFEF